ncbi:MAG: phosphotransferase family protein [Alphaproteobacteria bacterium]|nr:phosphotransferase family protein [Alphaproteobacteria bacterium]
MDQRIEQQPGHSGAWQRALAARLGAAVGPALGPPTALDGGALQRHWRIDLPVAGRVERVVLRRTGSRVLDSLPRPVEFAAQRAAWQAGVPAAEPLACGADFLVMRHLPGSADPQVALAAADPDALARDLATALARLHRVTPATAELPLAPAPADAGAATLAAYRAALDRRPRAHPVLEWGLRALEHAPPAPIAPVLVHGDFRIGNVLVEASCLTGVLDWEFSRWSDPHEDLGWFCVRYWRRQAFRRAAGGLVSREAFFAHYQQAGGVAVDPRRALYWELMGNIRWALIALAQADRGLDEGLVEQAIKGRRLAEVEAEILTLADQWVAGDA